MSNRIEKANSLIKKNLADIIDNELSDPRLKNEMITVSKVEMSPDLKYARVYLSFYGTGDKKDAITAIQNASGYIKKSLKERLKFRVLPEFHFVEDHSLEYSDHINSLLKQIESKDE